MLNEAMIINQLKEKFPDFIGDDAAVIDIHENQCYVITKDLLIEDIHFRQKYFSPEKVAQKALQVNVSDIAAMGAVPKWIVCGIGIPIEKGEYAQAVLKAFAEQCKQEHITLIGGDTTRSPDKLFISITAIGEISKANVKYRHTAKVSDSIAIVGNIGDAHVGFLACERSLSELEKYKNTFLRPIAKTKEGIWLGKQACVTSMMDVSDGLFIDLKRLCEASGVSGEIELDKWMIEKEFVEACQKLGVDPLQAFFSGGEDYSLLLTVKKENYLDLERDFFNTFDYPLKYIGTIKEGEGVHFCEKGKKKNINIIPFSHFGEKL